MNTHEELMQAANDYHTGMGHFAARLPGDVHNSPIQSLRSWLLYKCTISNRSHKRSGECIKTGPN